MRTFILKTILFGTIIALFALALAPALALAASGDMSGSHCGTSPAKAAAPASDNCLAHCQLVQCRISSAADARIVSYSSPDNFNLPVGLTAAVAAESPSVCRNAVPPQQVVESPPRFEATYQCRNSLNSDDPASL
ncbi:MAG: hypothetical protein Q7R50_07845 [Dehalococcoidales bacterium]|nr:hypothetical protein [Dehalococcoidales bacterium]